MYFGLLHARLVEHMRGRVRSGEMTERGMARLAGISQPYLHHVLKGARILSVAMADRVILNLKLSETELGIGRTCGVAHCLEIPLLAEPLGPRYPFPDLEGESVCIPFSALELAGATKVMAVRLSADPLAPVLFQANDIVVLEPLRCSTDPLDPEGYYAIDAGGCGCLRRIEAGGGSLRLSASPISGRPACISLLDRNILEVVRARVIWIGRYLKRRSIAEGPAETPGAEYRRPGEER
jgi:hypothetical protein